MPGLSEWFSRSRISVPVRHRNPEKDRPATVRSRVHRAGPSRSAPVPLHHDDAGQAVGQIQSGAQVLEEALVRDPAQILEQIAVVAEVRGVASWGCRR